LTALTYKDAGVDIKAGNQLVENIKSVAKNTQIPGVLAGLGGFGSLFELPVQDYQNPVLVSGTDGVGTKLKLAQQLKQHDTIGIDLVAMCVNDIIVCGAKPLYFLDYYATGKLDTDTATQVVTGIGQGCQLAQCALVGGETAEMPGMYHNEDYDLAGFVVGIVEKANIIDGSKVKPGDSLIALASSGPHSNGYSLIRKIIERENADLDASFGDTTLGQALLAPTKIYVRSILSLLEQTPIHAMAHITGGGLIENIPRVLPDNCAAVIEQLNMPDIFNWLQQAGEVAHEEMLKTFNCGVGMVICVAKENTQSCLDHLNTHGETAWQIGHIQSRKDNEPAVVI